MLVTLQAVFYFSAPYKQPFICHVSSWGKKYIKMKEQKTKDKKLSVALAAAREKDSKVPNVKQLLSASNMLMFATSGWTGDRGEVEWEGTKVGGGWWEETKKNLNPRRTGLPCLC